MNAILKISTSDLKEMLTRTAVAAYEEGYEDGTAKRPKRPESRYTATNITMVSIQNGIARTERAKAQRR